MESSTRPPRTTLIQSRLLRLLLPFGLAITLPMYNRRQLILARREMDEGELRHEYFHAWSIIDWGGWTYIGRHIEARVQHRSWTAPLSDVEFPAYEAQYPHLSPPELEDYLLNG